MKVSDDVFPTAAKRRQWGNPNPTYKYNADGLRTEKTVDNTTTWEYYWDNDKLIGMYDGESNVCFIPFSLVFIL